ncbi:MAG: hypothetical protein E7110_03440 [Bacteroidales bacterium]|nr:hypothetical protein [Bacteroidales bacterium]
MKRHIGLCLLLMAVSISGVLAGHAGAGRVEICSGARGCIVEAANGAQQEETLQQEEAGQQEAGREKAIYRVSYGAFRHYDNPSQARSRKIVYRFGL